MEFDGRLFGIQCAFSAAGGAITAVSLEIFPLLYRVLSYPVAQIGWVTYSIGVAGQALNPGALFVVMFLVGRGLDLRLNALGEFLSLMLGAIVGFIVGFVPLFTLMSLIAFPNGEGLASVSTFTLAELLTSSFFGGALVSFGAASLGHFTRQSAG